jgi:CheY-like chemotaxis protein
MTSVAAPKLEPEIHPLVGRRVLVAEDSPTTHEILKLLLTQHGHHVDIATDGEQALEAIRSNRYDVALLDFHLPKMDGLRVATAIKNEMHGLDRPRLIAITADLQGLLAHKDGCENFDLIIPKPLDIYRISQIIEGQAELRDEQQAELHEPGLHSAPSLAPSVVPGDVRQPFALEGLGYDFLLWPQDIDVRRLSARGTQATLGDPRFDAIVITQPVSVEGLVSLWERKALYVLPIVDLTGTLGRKADFDGSKLSTPDTERLGRLIRDFHDRRARLHRDLLFSDKLGEQLIGRMFVANRPLTAALDPRYCHLASYDVPLGRRLVTREAEILCEHGLLKREFFERFHICPACGSYRLHVREECSQCRSSNLSEEQYLHHFRCAFQGPEPDFRRGDELICPKCHQELTHFGFDYDRPGTMIVCGSCGHAASEPSVGFVCLDCGAHTDSDVAATRDVFSYQLTDQGVSFAEKGGAVLGYARDVLRFADLPLELVVALNAAAKRYNEDKIPFSLVNILYRRESEVVAEYGARRFAQARDLFIENLRAALDKRNTVVKGQSHDFALFEGIGPDRAQSDLDHLKERASRALFCDLGPEFQAFGPEDFS